ncbi:MAG: cupredoxin family copper-binding protein [Chloroflexota bacterium]
MNYSRSCAWGTTSWGLLAIRTALVSVVIFACLFAPLESGLAHDVGTPRQTESVLAIVRVDGSVHEAVIESTTIRTGDTLATIGDETTVLMLRPGARLEFGGRTTIEIVSGIDPNLVIRLVEGAVVLRSTGHLLDALTLVVEDRAMIVPVQIAGSGWALGLSRSPDSQVIIACERCPGGIGFTGELETLDTGRMRTYDARGDSFESRLSDSLFNSLAEFPDDGSTGDRRPIGQRTATNRRPSKERESTRERAPQTPSPTAIGSPSTASATVTPVATPTRVTTTVHATIANFVYLPDPVRVPVGSSIQWVNLDFENHTVTAIDRSWTSAVLTLNGTFTRTFNQLGTFDYFCEPHPQMVGTIIVE